MSGTPRTQPAHTASTEPPQGLRALFRFPDFGWLPDGRVINETLSLLIRAAIVFAAVLAVWALAASALRTAWLIGPHGPLFTASAPAHPIIVHKLNAWEKTGLLLVQIARGVGGVAAVTIVAALVGAMLGFLFGIPTRVSAAGAAPAPPPAGGASAGGTGKTAWQSSTNLTQVSDWLTKIIVGVGLVEAGNVWSGFIGIVMPVANWLFEYRHGSPAVLGGAMIGAAALGFLFCYLYTDIIVAPLIAAADATLGGVPVAAQVVIAMIGAQDEVLGPRISRLPQTGELPSPTLAKAAMLVYGLDMKTLGTPRDVKMWARAHAVMNDFGPAADGYMHMLSMPADDAAPVDAGLLIEAGRVLYAANRKDQAAVIVDQAVDQVKTKSDVKPDIRQAVVGDAVVLRLAGYVPGGYADALDLIATQLENPAHDLPNDDAGRLHLLRALANGQRYAKDTSLDTAARTELLGRIVGDLKVVITIGKYSRAMLREFCVAPIPPPADPRMRHDDLAAAYGESELKALLTDPPAAAAPPAVAGQPV